MSFTKRWEISTLCVSHLVRSPNIGMCYWYKNCQPIWGQCMFPVQRGPPTLKENTPLWIPVLFLRSLGYSDRDSVSCVVFHLSPLSGHCVRRLSVAWCPSWPRWTDCLDLVASIFIRYHSPGEPFLLLCFMVWSGTNFCRGQSKS